MIAITPARRDEALRKVRQYRATALDYAEQDATAWLAAYGEPLEAYLQRLDRIEAALVPPDGDVDAGR